ncbi:enoyl-CoA hydratase-related protein [Streptomyces sp. ACA25]|uniref:enoyl-CoA hydratase/isomerase family protein n=1 Tax=Streptomyces sp. ACA25 TaxID=3022596 RepID=UPI002307742E|nr:enoyl-CoA hydratase-related protein [Streptomyces sp. ACA25]MDB1086882.1 enoyl-CoA hydratase-related protein [Streptomyces sp. ACA25]
MADTDTVRYDVTDQLATITLDRPGAMNALDIATKEALRAALHRAAEDPEVRAVLLTGSGRAFCVGQDLKEHIGELSQGGGSALNTVAVHYNPIVNAIAEMRKPVVAGVNGVAAGAGMGFALAADYRVVAESATFTTAFAGIALTADSGLSWTLPRLIGAGRAADLLLFPRKIDAREAERLGIAQQVVADEELAAVSTEVARRLAAGPTVAYAAIKESLAHAAGHTLAESLEREGELQVRAGDSEDHHAAVAAFVAKEKPVFRGR